MGKFGFGITLSISLMACGSNAENNVIETPETKQQKEVVVTSEMLEELIEEKEVVEGLVPVMVEEYIEVEEKKVKELLKKEAVNTEDVKVVVTETVVEKTAKIVVVKPKHDVWNALTQKNVTVAGKVNYKGMKAELSQLTTYLTHLNNTPPKADWSENEKLAYWINLYNASTVYLIASNYPTTSITKLNGGKPWDKKFVKSGDKVYSLNQIENEIVRPRFKEPRIHAALNCAAVSCPKMLNAAFLPSKLSAQLDAQCYAWINDRGRNEVGPNSLKISQIFDWYKDDFKAGGGVIKFVGKYNRTKIMINPKAAISYKEYNWDLNE